MIIKTILSAVVITASVGAFTVTTATPAFAKPAFAKPVFHKPVFHKPVFHKHCVRGTSTGTGRAYTKRDAKWAARLKWRYVVIKDYGTKYATWRMAKNKRYNKCKKHGYWKAKYWKCRAQATPCSRF